VAYGEHRSCAFSGRRGKKRRGAEKNRGNAPAGVKKEEKVRRDSSLQRERGGNGEGYPCLEKKEEGGGHTEEKKTESHGKTILFNPERFAKTAGRGRDKRRSRQKGHEREKNGRH